MPQTYSLLSQRDPRWAGMELGYNTAPADSIGWEGCLLTCVAMAAGVAPDALNDALKSVRGYLDGGYMIFGVVRGALASIPGARNLRFVGMTQQHRYDPFPVDDLLTTLKTLRGDIPGRQAVILDVNFGPGGPYRQHFVLATHLDHDDPDPEKTVIMTHDPWLLPADQIETPLTPRYGPRNSYAIVRAVYMEMMT